MVTLIVIIKLIMTIIAIIMKFTLMTMIIIIIMIMIVMLHGIVDNCLTYAVSVMIMRTHATYLCALYISLHDFNAVRK